MYANQQSPSERRGIVLVLVLAMLGLLALVGVTFATFAGQSKINARNFAQSIIQPQDDELMDFALSQLINDTSDPRSVLHGHSLARDMYGNDANHNGYLQVDPLSGLPFTIQSFSTVSTSANAAFVNITTSVPSTGPAYYGLSFPRWIMRVSYVGPLSTGGAKIVDQTLEILIDNASGTTRVFQVAVGPYTEDSTTTPKSIVPYTLTNPTLATSTKGAVDALLYNNPTLFALFTPANAALDTNLANVNNYVFSLDGRWLHAFSGTGIGAKAKYGNFRYNSSLGVGGPGSVGMDEDYDACDLENWFLAIQSADGHLVIPSFHRPSVVRYDPNNATAANQVNDWGTTKSGTNYRLTQGADSMARILRPVAADGNDALAFPDLIPDPFTGKITYDVDNDADGVPDSVWLDLGYPARRDSRGHLYKPLFAFMVIGLNGRIPLNTAGNLAGTLAGTPGGPTHANHLGNSISEVDPTYALQNANQGPSVDYDPFNTSAGLYSTPSTTPFTNNTQVDNGSVPVALTAQPIDVRLTQLRNLLAGTKPQPNTLSQPLDPLNGDQNLVYGSWPGTGAGGTYYMPNGMYDGVDNASTDPAGNLYVSRKSAPVAGRWGEAQAVPGVPITIPTTTTPAPVANVLRGTYGNPVRAGYSADVSDLISGLPRYAADDDYDYFDPSPTGHNGEINDTDAYDLAGALLLPIDRFRRFVTPADINGTGRVTFWPKSTGSTVSIAGGPDQFGRVQYSSYFRPLGAPGVIGVNYTVAGSIITPAPGTTPGAVYYPTNPPLAPDPFYTGGPNTAGMTYASATNYLPDTTNNPFHGFESFKNPYIVNGSGKFTPGQGGGMEDDQTTSTGIPTNYPTYTYTAFHTDLRNDGLNNANELNLYAPNPLLDSPFEAADLEWLYRQQDFDGASLSSRLSSLAPISFNNTIDGQRRRRLFSVDSWEMNNFVWSNDNPGTGTGAFPNNSSFNVGQSANFTNLSQKLAVTIATPPLAQRDKKINLNYPLPVSNDPHEPIRQKWINDTYQLLKSILPPRSVDTAEELAQLGQFVVNVIDFRDPDGTITIWTNPDLMITPGTVGVVGPLPTGTAPTLSIIPTTGIPLTAYAFVQYGAEYNPIAINEALAYTYAYYNPMATAPQANRFFIEFVNTLTQSAIAALPPAVGPAVNPPDPSILDLGGFVYTNGDPYSGGTWDIVFTGDDAGSRPDPYRGELVLGGNVYAATPLNRDSFSTTSGAATIPGTDVNVAPLSQTTARGTPDPVAANIVSVPATPPLNYYYVIGNVPPAVGTTSYEKNAPLPTTTWTTGSVGVNGASTLNQTFIAAYDPLNPVTGGPSTPPFVVRQGILPGVVAGTTSGTTTTPAAMPANYKNNLPPITTGAASPGQTRYYWVCLRRPADPFAPVSLTNPMVVVDSMRFPYLDGTIQPTVAGPIGGPPKVPSASLAAVGNTGGNALYSAQRIQPYRGGHAVPAAPTLTTLPTTSTQDTRYGYSEQIAVPTTYNNINTQGIYYVDTTQAPPVYYPGTNTVYHTLGAANDSNEPWDFLPFHDRDFTSVAELMLVPGCPPGLFTKQFTEFAPTATGTPLTPVVFPQVTALSAPAGALPASFATASTAFAAGGANPIVPHTFPYLVDKFFYTGASLSTGTAVAGVIPAQEDILKTSVGGPSSDGWFKMFEFVEVPSLMNGAIGQVANGTNFDWARQDFKPGLLNLNLIVDEEVFFSILGKHDASFNQTLLNNVQLPTLPAGTYSLPLNGNSPIPAYGSPIPMVVSAIDANGSPSFVYPISSGSGSGYTDSAGDPLLKAINAGSTATPPPSNIDSRIKAAFAQFLWLRHGGSGYIFGFGNAAVGQNSAVVVSDPPVTPPTPIPADAGQGIPAERPFHSLSYPDIDFTVMRPASLPPSLYTNPQSQLPAAGVYTAATNYTQDPGVRNPFIYPSFSTAYPPFDSVTAPSYPGLIPPRRLFQVPDGNTTSNASDGGDTAFVNNLQAVAPTTPPTTVVTGMPWPTAGALPPYTYTATGAATATTFAFTSGYPSLVWSGDLTGVKPVHLGTSTGTGTDNRQHPYWRIEMMQRVMNQTTVRTHQYAVWITVGFFEVIKQGDLSMLAFGNPIGAFDIIGPEVGSVTGNTTRFRGFFLVDRTKLTGYDPSNIGSFRAAVVYRKVIQ